ncbi:hypothetical protein PPYR_01985 [Photinus pyralis]|uniref:Piwi domain-containing protein n=2 Tax=Photinus pyralis TaxID=7054 RepID=A0A5N4B5Y5_PHOPY|nr:piwi-like protein Siwi [Photinus pyralis]XP_031328335.1 piwi-like protein Siwi [Photinus pyralis]XP_031328336.1 piwi-like protein Siwi [Photinus pyralis]KAB0805015.1 hypothetical protein PPYR_01985 [Photinus pyralis]
MDQQRGRGRARGRARGAGDQAGGPPQPRAQQAPRARGPPGPPQSRGPPPGMAGPPPQQAWGQPTQVMQQARAPHPSQTHPVGGRATHRSDAPSAEAQHSGTIGGDNGNGGDNGAAGRRGNMRGRRQLHVGGTIMRTRPEALPTKKGTHGNPVKLCANYFKLLQKPDWSLYQYRVDFSPEEDRTNVKKGQFRRATREVLTGYIFDGTVMFTPTRLNPDPMELFIKDEHTNADVRISIRLVKDVAAGDYQYLQLFNIIMRKCLSHLNLQLVGRNFFDAVAKVSIPEHHMELWPGYVTSIRQHENDILMCAEITHKVMRYDTVLQLLNECVESDRNNYKTLFQKRIIGSVVLTEYNNRTYHIDDVDFNTSPSSTFNKRDGTSISFVQYFKDRYNLNISDKRQPMLVSRAKAREIRSGMAEMVFLVPELCRMTGLTDSQRANFQLMRALADHTRVGPGARIQKLLAFSQRLRSKPEIVQELQQYDLALANNLVEFAGRVLPPEKIMCGDGRSYSAGAEVDWTRELRSNAMVHAVPLNTWVVVCPNRVKDKAQSFVQMLTRAANGMRWNLPFPKLQEIRDDRTPSYIDGIDAAMANHNPQLIMCVATNNKADRYASIKKKCCVEKAVPTQVILAKNLDSKGAMSIATKVAIQLNCKIGGAPWSIPLPYKNLMVVGYDVCHDASHKEKSYGALVATLNPECIRYFSSVTAHFSGEELSNDLALGVIKACRKWESINGSLPDKIMIYRDGVGDGQLPYVFEHEVKNVMNKLGELYGGENKVKLSFIVVSKRINTRIFAGPNNPAPGTVVDDVITLPERYDFFIVSQCVRQGTVSPTSYNVIFDSMGLDADKIQRLTYKLTHMYFNWSGAVRVPAPCQYAHKLAFLIGQFVQRNPSPDLENVLYYL